MLTRFRDQVPLLIGVGVCVLGIDGIIILYRAIGLPKDMAIYAGVLTFMGVASLFIRRYFQSHSEISTPKDEENDHA